MNKIIEAKDYLDKLFKESEYLSTNPQEKSYRYEHTLRVASWGQKIAIAEGLDQEALVVGCLLHDVAYIEAMPKRDQQINHGRRASEIVKDFVYGLGFNTETAHAILYGIATHVDGKSDFEGTPTVLSESISNADNLDRFDVYRIYESLWYDDFRELSLEAKLEYCEKRIAGCKQKNTLEFATDYATLVFREELKYMQGFFEKLLNQLQTSIWE